MAKRYWKNTYQYQRILEILDDYWLSEKDEESIEIVMRFKHTDGREQEKVIWWDNPNIQRPYEELKTINLCDKE